MSQLTDQLELPCGLLLPNRLTKAAMTEGLADGHNYPTEAHNRLYTNWGQGGIGLQITGNVQVDRRYLEAAGNVVIDGPQTQETRAKFRDFANAAKTGGAPVIMQISHAGRQTPKAVNERPVAPSAIPLDIPGRALLPFGAPRALTTEEVYDIVGRFVSAIKIAEEAGFDGVQIHGAHGYLISQFLSPKTNKREDEWGGTAENRARLLLEIIRKARAEVRPSFAIGVKLNSADFQQGGFTHEACLNVVDWLNAEAIDFIEISGGNYEQPEMMGADFNTKEKADERPSASTKAREAYFVEYAKSVSARAKVPVMATGGFRTKSAMEAALTTGMVDLIGLARPLCAEPDLPRALLDGEAVEAVDYIGLKKLGPTQLLSEKSPFKTIRALNIWARQAWHMVQIERMGEGKAPDLDLSLLPALMQMQKAQKASQKAYHASMMTNED